MHFHARFSILGEVVEMLVPSGDPTRLYIDISTPHDPANPNPDGFVYRTAFVVDDAVLIEEMLERVAIGDVIEASGKFWQAGYVPHQGSYVDTTFQMAGYRNLGRRPGRICSVDPFAGLMDSAAIH